MVPSVSIILLTCKENPSEKPQTLDGRWYQSLKAFVDNSYEAYPRKCKLGSRKTLILTIRDRISIIFWLKHKGTFWTFSLEACISRMIRAGRAMTEQRILNVGQWIPFASLSHASLSSADRKENDQTDAVANDVWRPLSSILGYRLAKSERRWISKLISCVQGD